MSELHVDKWMEVSSNDVDAMPMAFQVGQYAVGLGLIKRFAALRHRGGIEPRAGGLDHSFPAGAMNATRAPVERSNLTSEAVSAGLWQVTSTRLPGIATASAATG